MRTAVRLLWNEVEFTRALCGEAAGAYGSVNTMTKLTGSRASTTYGRAECVVGDVTANWTGPGKTIPVLRARHHVRATTPTSSTTATATPTGSTTTISHPPAAHSVPPWSPEWDLFSDSEGREIFIGIPNDSPFRKGEIMRLETRTLSPMWKQAEP